MATITGRMFPGPIHNFTVHTGKSLCFFQYSYCWQEACRQELVLMEMGTTGPLFRWQRATSGKHRQLQKLWVYHPVVSPWKAPWGTCWPRTDPSAQSHVARRRPSASDDFSKAPYALAEGRYSQLNSVTSSSLNLLF